MAGAQEACDTAAGSINIRLDRRDSLMSIGVARVVDSPPDPPPYG